MHLLIDASSQSPFSAFWLYHSHTLQRCCFLRKIGQVYERIAEYNGVSRFCSQLLQPLRTSKYVVMKPRCIVVGIVTVAVTLAATLFLIIPVHREVFREVS